MQRPAPHACAPAAALLVPLEPAHSCAHESDPHACCAVAHLLQELGVSSQALSVRVQPSDGLSLIIPDCASILHGAALESGSVQ